MFKITLSGTCFFKTSFVQSSEPTLLVLPFVGKSKKQEVIRCGEVVERCLKVDWGGSGWAMGGEKGTEFHCYHVLVNNEVMLLLLCNFLVTKLHFIGKL